MMANEHLDYTIPILVSRGRVATRTLGGSGVSAAESTHQGPGLDTGIDRETDGQKRCRIQHRDAVSQLGADCYQPSRQQHTVGSEIAPVWTSR